jgi:formylglycine-generating enzyme required for sulfatase activity
MKTQLSQIVRFLSILCWAALAAGPPASAQTPPGLDLQLYAGLSITGTVGSVYSVEYVTDLAKTNSWRCLEFLQLLTSPYLWADKSAPATGQRFYRATLFAAPTNLVFIPPGTFRMGSPTNEVGRFDEEGPQTEVTISRGFWMGKYLVTQGDYLALMGTNPSYFTTKDSDGNPISPDLSRPVESVSWSDASNYCEVLTQRERTAGRIATNSLYRLPTEGEWEYACRAWTSTRFSYGDDPGYTNLTDYAWYMDNAEGMTHPVGQKLPNPWGLYDLHGNVWQWCQDWWTGPLPGGLALDPKGRPNGDYRVVRGGDWYVFTWNCRSAYRRSGDPQFSPSNYGFRIVLAPGRP